MKIAVLFLSLYSAVSFSQTDFEKGSQLFALQQFGQARPFFENDLRDHPNREQSLVFLGDIAGHLQQWEKAASLYKTLSEKRPTRADYQYKYGGALAMVARGSNKLYALMLVGEIESAFITAIKNDPKHVEARWALVELYLQLPGIAGGSEQKAMHYANELARLSVVDGYLSKGRIAEYFKRYAVAEQYYRKAVEVGKSRTCHQKLADLYQNKMKQPEKAREVWAEYYKTKG